MIIRLWLSVLVTLFLVGCKSADIRSFQPNEEITASSEGENRLWHQSSKFDDAMHKGRHVPDLPKLQSYLQGIMDRLYPEFQGSITVNLHKAPVLNAFALPNGSIYINLGMLASLENEAQIASVLAHEGIHFLQKHSAKQRIYNQNSRGWAIAVSMIGIPLVGELVAMNSMSGYSQLHETEADNLGFERLLKAGYRTTEATRAFEILAREVKASEVEEPYFFASHPKLQKRITNFRQLNEKNGNSAGVVGFKEYQMMVSGIREQVLEQKLAAGKVNAVIAMLDDEKSAELYPEKLNYFKAIAKLKQEDEDSHLEAEELLLAEVKHNPNFAEAHRALGFYYVKNQQEALASQHLEHYLRLAPDNDDHSFAEYYLNKMK